MAFTELSRIVERLQSGRSAPHERAGLARELATVRDVLLRLGASESAAQLDLAADLLAGGSAEAELERMVLTLVEPLERAFRCETPAPLPAPAGRERSAPLRAKLGIARDMLLGEMLVHFGVVAPEQLARALEERRTSRQRLGEILVAQGATTAEEIERALAYQARLRGESKPAATAPEPSPSAPARRPERRPAPARVAKAAPAAAQPPPAAPARFRMARDLLLGEVLVLQGVLSRPNLARALELQRRRGCLLGETLLELKLVTRRQLEAALTFQGRSQGTGAARRAA